MSAELKANVILICILMALFIALMTGVYWIVESGKITQYDKNYAADINGQPKSEFKVGDEFFYCRAGEVLKSASRTIYSSVVRVDTPIEIVYLRFPISTGALPNVGPFGQCYRAAVIPAYFPPGEYEWRVRGRFTLNALRTGETEDTPAIKFKVIK